MGTDEPRHLGVLVECDPSIKAIIVKINKDDNEYIVEDLDDQHLVIKESMVNQLKAALDKVGHPSSLLA
jgi:TFIIH basal transcription factor complex TTD-A subunit